MTARVQSAWMRKFALLIALVGALAALGATAASAARTAKTPPFPNIPGNWSHAEINVTIDGQPHTLILDRGRIVQVSATQVTLFERTGARVVVPMNAQTIVRIYGYPATIYMLRRLMFTWTMRIDGGPAVRIRVVR
jgi:hypothetical protein